MMTRPVTETSKTASRVFSILFYCILGTVFPLQKVLQVIFHILRNPSFTKIQQIHTGNSSRVYNFDGKLLFIRSNNRLENFINQQ